MLSPISPNGFTWNGCRAPEGATRVIRRLLRNPASAIAAVTAPMRQAACRHTANSRPPPAIPSTIETKVLISSKALPRDRSRSGSISGTIPYFAGLNTVACRPIRKTTSSIPPVQPVASAARPNSITAISNTFTPIRTLRLLTRSARWPL